MLLMSTESTETTSNNARQGAASNVATHFILGPIFIITFAVAINFAIHAPGQRLLHWWLVVVAFAFILLNVQQRMYSLRVQDRVIRLEERLRLMTVAPAIDTSRISLRQLIALRFASDAELPALAQRAIAENLTGAEIKGAITTWRPDNERI
jgi:hypothetical protein